MLSHTPTIVVAGSQSEHVRTVRSRSPTEPVIEWYDETDIFGMAVIQLHQPLSLITHPHRETNLAT